MPATQTPLPSKIFTMSQNLNDITMSDTLHDIIDHEDLDPSSESEPDETAERLQRNNDIMQSALLGYAKADILTLDLEFGRWNDRKVKSQEVEKLVKSLEIEGIRRYVKENVIPIVVDEKDVDVGKLAKEPSYGADVYPRLEFKINPTGPILAAGGQHRRAAILEISKKLKTDISELENQEPDDETQDARRKLKISEKKRKLKRVGFWGIAVYAKGNLIFVKFKFNGII